MNNIKPRTRSERIAEKDKDILEKTRINQRVGPESKHINAKDLIFKADPESTLYCPENQRFDKDFAQFHREQREQKIILNELKIEKQRVMKLDREAQNWEKQEQQEALDAQRRQHQQDVLLMAKRNCNGIPYNPITLQYAENKEGEQLRLKDENAVVRALVRSTNIDQRANCGYNLITGEQRPGILVQDKFKGEYEQRLQKSKEFYQEKIDKNQVEFYMAPEEVDRFVKQKISANTKFPLPSPVKDSQIQRQPHLKLNAVPVINPITWNQIQEPIQQKQKQLNNHNEQSKNPTPASYQAQGQINTSNKQINQQQQEVLFKPPTKFMQNNIF